MPSAVKGLWYLLGFTTSTGLSHRWLTDMLAADYAALETGAASLPPGSNGILAVPHFNGRPSPFEPLVKGAFVGFDDTSGPAHFYRALLESAAYDISVWMMRAKALRPDVALERIINIGGGAQSPLWSQIKADVTGIAFSSARPDVNASRGAALIAATAIGAVEITDPRWFAAEHLAVRSFAPDPSRHAVYRGYSDAYATLFKRLAPVYATLARLSAANRPSA